MTARKITARPSGYRRRLASITPQDTDTSGRPMIFAYGYGYLAHVAGVRPHDVSRAVSEGELDPTDPAKAIAWCKRRRGEPRKPFVFSIKREFVERILDGSKRFEYRTKCPSVVDGDTILIYQTGNGGIVASAVVGNVIEGSPIGIWGHTKHAAGIERADFDAYFDDREVAYAIPLRDVVRFDEPAALPKGVRAPQSWAEWRGPWPLEGGGL